MASTVPVAPAASLPNILCYRFLGMPLTLDVAATALYMMYYLYLAPSLLGVCAALAVAGVFAGSQVFKSTFGSSTMQYAIALHIVAWIAQFYGHGVHERRSPALLSSLWQALAMAPLFVLMEVGMLCGLLSDFKREMLPEIGRRISKFKNAVRNKIK